MADRKKKQKGARKAASKPNTAAREAVAGGPMGPPFGGAGEITEPVPFEGMSGTGTMVPVPSDLPPPGDLRANERIQSALQELPVTPPQTGIQGVAATTPETHTVTVDADFVVKTLASVDAPQDPIIIAGVGGLAANAVVPARSRGPRRKRAGATGRPRQVTKARLLRQADVAEAALKKLAPPHGGMGHNSQRRAIRWPLTHIQYDRAMAAIRSLRDALATGGRAAMKAAGKTLARTTVVLGRWVKPRVDKAADAFAKTAGVATAMNVTGADKQLTTLIKMIGQFLGTH